MNDTTNEKTVDPVLRVIDEALANGEPKPGIDMSQLLHDVGSLVGATAWFIHLRTHDYDVDADDVRNAAYQLMTCTSEILVQLR